MEQKRILVAALNWGLGHAARCIPIIKALEENNFKVLLASDGAALELLRKEFPHLKYFELPSYQIHYAENANYFKWKLILDSPKIMRAIQAEKILTKQIVEEENLSGIISDNRLGVRYRYVKSIFITHQLNVLTGNTTFFSSKLHQKYIRKFDQCWIPDTPGSKNLSGILGHLKKREDGHVYIGPVSRFEKRDLPQIHDYLVLLSGPEPQRTFLEELLLEKLKDTDKKVLFVRGIMDDADLDAPNSNILVRNNMYGNELEEAINSSKLIIARSGYTTIMDLSKLEKKAFFIPTPGQFEQQYLAERLMKLGIVPYCDQKEFSLEKLEQVKNYSGLKDPGFAFSFRELFSFF